ncbi:MAG: glycosyltransferase [Bacteroidales bacterium]|nr:glycosyltransferase [Bacteroidales bacterium]
MKIIQLIENDPFILIPGLFLLVFFVQLFYYLFYYSRILFVKQVHRVTGINEPVSIVICARNEEENLKKNLPSFLNQDYPNFEVVVVNDCSEDDSEIILDQMQKQYAHLKVTTIKPDEKFFHSKKLALTIGIKAAKNEWLLLTDADCYAESPKWIERMQRKFTEKTDIVLGYGGFVHEKGFLNNLIRFDALFIAIQYLSFAMARRPYMGVGRNLAYKKSLFIKNKGFATHHKLISGDDDLFIKEVATKTNTNYEISHESITRTIAKDSFYEWFRQKKRHTTTSKYYKLSTKIRLFFEPFSRILFYILFALSLIWYTEYYPYILGVFGLRMILQLIIYKVAINHLKEKYLLLPSLLYDIILPFLGIAFYVSNIFSTKQVKWK